MGTFAQRGLDVSSLDHCGSPIPITRDAAIPSTSFYIGRGTRILALRISPRALARHLPGYLPTSVQLDAVLDPGVVSLHLSLPR